MALQGIGSHYWPGDGAGPGPPEPGDYHQWQVVPITADRGFFLIRRYKPFERLWKRVRRFIPQRVWISVVVLGMIWFGGWYWRAKKAVTEVSTTEGFRDHMWGEVGRQAARVDGTGENMHRHFFAAQKFGRVPHQQQHRRNIMLELAYFVRREYD